MKDVDVLIVGAGPVGLQMGLSLLREGLSIAIVDKKSGRTESSNAVGVNCRTMEIWQTLGFLDEAIKRGAKVHSTSLYNGSKLLNQVSFELINSEYPFMLALPQAETEKLLLEQLAMAGQQVLWNTELTELCQDSAQVSAKCNALDSEITINAKWAIGCDGYHSKVRDLSGLTRICNDLPLHFLMVDAVVTGNVHLDSVNIVFNDKGMIFMIPMQNNIRVVAEISGDKKYQILFFFVPQVFREIIKDRYPEMNIECVDWSSAFYIHECLADNYRNGRIFIAGDAAHTHSPMGGQGMNTGIQDTWNLAWKLAQVFRGEATDELLNSYSLERRAIGHDVLERSGKLTTMATTDNFMLKHLRNFGISHLADLEMIKSKLVNGISQANICYENSYLVDHQQVVKTGHLKYPRYQDGWRVLSVATNAEIRHDLPKFVTMTTIDKLPSDYKFALIRPDGYTAMYSQTLDQISEYFAKNF